MKKSISFRLYNKDTDSRPISNTLFEDPEGARAIGLVGGEIVSTIDNYKNDRFNMVVSIIENVNTIDENIDGFVKLSYKPQTQSVRLDAIYIAPEDRVRNGIFGGVMELIDELVKNCWPSIKYIDLLAYEGKERMYMHYGYKSFGCYEDQGNFGEKQFIMRKEVK